MSAISSQSGSQVGSNFKFAEKWKGAIERYEKITATKMTTLVSATTVDEVLKEIQQKESTFKGKRHDASKTDKFRTLVSKGLHPIDQLGMATAEGVASVCNSQTLFAVIGDNVLTSFG